MRTVTRQSVTPLRGNARAGAETRRMIFDGRLWDASLLGWAFSACNPLQPLVLLVRSPALDAIMQRRCLTAAKGAYDVHDGFFPQRHCRIELS
jgi:hypothetical protein